MEEFSFEPSSVRPRQLAVQTMRTAISGGTELANYLGLDPDVFRPNGWCRYPWVPGYSGVGRVVACGPDARGFQPGDRILGLLRHSSHQFVDLDDPRWPVMVIDDSVGDSDAALVRLLGIAAHIARLAGPGPAISAVWGQGVIGNFTAQLLGLADHTVIAVDSDPVRLAMSRACGVPLVHDGTTTDSLLSLIRERTGGKGLDVAIDAVGQASVTLRLPEYLRPGGLLVLATHWRSQMNLDASPLVNAIFQKDIHVRGGFEAASVTWHEWATAVPSTWSELLRLIKAGRLQLQPAKTCVISPEQIDIYESLARAGSQRPLTALIAW